MESPFHQSTSDLYLCPTGVSSRSLRICDLGLGAASMTDHCSSSATLSGSGSGSTERTPLIPKSHSVTIIPSAIEHHTTLDGYDDNEGQGIGGYSDGEDEDGPKGREVEVYKPGKSTFTQTVSSTNLTCQPTIIHRDKSDEMLTTYGVHCRLTGLAVECPRGSYRHGSVGYAHSSRPCRMATRRRLPTLNGSRYSMDVSL